jgi:hypothetical protein
VIVIEQLDRSGIDDREELQEKRRLVQLGPLVGDAALSERFARPLGAG